MAIHQGHREYWLSLIHIYSSDAADKSNTDSTADSTTTAGSETNDKVTISNNDKPYLSLGADLTPDQLSLIHIYLKRLTGHVKAFWLFRICSSSPFETYS